MPYKSEKQSRFMHSKHPKIAAKWDREMPAGKSRGSGGGKLIRGAMQGRMPGRGRGAR